MNVVAGSIQGGDISGDWLVLTSGSTMVADRDD